MSQKNLNARMISKHDTQAKWENVSDFIPYKGEIIVYDRDDNHSYERIKVGDGITNVNALPFVYEPVTEADIIEICGINIILGEEASL